MALRDNFAPRACGRGLRIEIGDQPPPGWKEERRQSEEPASGVIEIDYGDNDNTGNTDYGQAYGDTSAVKKSPGPRGSNVTEGWTC